MNDDPKNLIAECRALGIQLAVARDSGLEIDAPEGALTPELMHRLRAQKFRVLEILGNESSESSTKWEDPRRLWLATLEELQGDELFPDELLGELREAKVEWNGSQRGSLTAKAN